MNSLDARDAGWSVVLPIKPPASGKSRLSVSGVDRVAVARALAIDTIDALAGARRVRSIAVVTADESWARELARDRDDVIHVPEDGVAGLNAAVRRGIAAADPRCPVAVVVGDLPSLTTGVVDEVLAAAAERERAVIADRQGTGTTMLFAAAGVGIQPAFGAGSLARHLALGHAALPLAGDSPARRDVDTVADLLRIPATELGSATRALLSPAPAR